MRQLCRVLQASTDAVSSGLLGWLVRETRNIGKKKECSTKPGDVSNACHVSLAVRDLFETEGETCSMYEMSVAVPVRRQYVSDIPWKRSTSTKYQRYKQDCIDRPVVFTTEDRVWLPQACV